jgi:hypothetical protein
VAGSARRGAGALPGAANGLMPRRIARYHGIGLQSSAGLAGTLPEGSPYLGTRLSLSLLWPSLSHIRLAVRSTSPLALPHPPSRSRRHARRLTSRASRLTAGWCGAPTAAGTLTLASTTGAAWRTLQRKTLATLTGSLGGWVRRTASWFGLLDRPVP